MILGTVEIGLNYGINNNDGKPSVEQAYELLDAAKNDNIIELDTAAAYGESEAIIGDFQADNNFEFLIDTKLPTSIPVEQYENSLSSSLKKLHTKSLNVLYLHSFEQCKNKQILDFLLDKKNKNIIKKIGISIYEPHEMEYIIDNLPFVDVIQFPFNIFDCHRWLEGDLLKRAKQSKKQLYVRSVFLQGLIFKAVSDPFIQSLNAGNYIEGINDIAKRYDFTIAEMAYKYVSDLEEIDEILIGCQGRKELLMNVDLIKSDKKISSEMRSELDRLSKDISVEIIDPRKWRR